MKSATAVTLDTNLLIRKKAECAQHRISFSSYLEFAIEVAPPIDEKLAQFIGARKLPAAPVSFDEFQKRRPCFHIPQKNWHFHDYGKGLVQSCMRVKCDLPEVASTEFYLDDDDNIRDAKENRIIWPAMTKKTEEVTVVPEASPKIKSY